MHSCRRSHMKSRHTVHQSLLHFSLLPSSKSYLKLLDFECIKTQLFHVYEGTKLHFAQGNYESSIKVRWLKTNSVEEKAEGGGGGGEKQRETREIQSFVSIQQWLTFHFHIQRPQISVKHPISLKQPLKKNNRI